MTYLGDHFGEGQVPAALLLLLWMALMGRLCQEALRIAPEVPLAELAQKPSRPVLVVHPPPPILPIGRPLLRKGEPAHAYFPQPSGNNCLPPR